MYTCKYSCRYASEVAYTIKRCKDLRNVEELKVLSFGCGPCTDLFAIDYLYSQGILNYKKLKYRGVDYSKNVWKYIHRDIKQFETSDILIGTVMGASFIHSVLCYFPIIYQRLTEAGQKTLAEHVINDIMVAIMPAFIVHYVITWIFPQLLLFVLIIQGKTVLKRWTVFLNPFIFLVFGSICSFLAPQVLQPVYVGIINKGNTVLFLVAAIYSYRLLDKRGKTATT